MDMGGFEVLYRNELGGNRRAFFKCSDHNEARAEFNRYYGDKVDETPLRITRNDVFGNRTHTWTCDNNWDSCLRLIGTFGHEREQRERRRYRRYSKRSGDRG